MKTFPYQYVASKAIRFYPNRPDTFSGDVLEVGPGRGDLLLSLAAASAQTQFVAIELGKKRFDKLIPRIEKRGLTNIVLIQGDVRVVLPKYLAGHAFEKIYILFPDPWPKKRHSPKRLLTAEFLQLIAAFLKPAGDLIIATDVTFYALWVVQNAETVPQLCSVGTPFVDSSVLSDYEPTFFEAKWRGLGRDIHYLWFRRSPHPCPSP
ncbi:MAG TPA: hypothetical protein VN285_12140 [Candidatus Deferrimicrobium sp.]|nr:hypothetical protein [Candidatus Deferrimicrobium sp.]